MSSVNTRQIAAQALGGKIMQQMKHMYCSPVPHPSAMPHSMQEIALDGATNLLYCFDNRYL